MAIYITGDIHGEFNRIADATHFFEYKEEDYFIVCGDFGIWDTKNVKTLLKMASFFPCTVLFCDGNHENFKILYSFPVVNYLGGKAHKIADNIYHLIRGEVYEIEGKKFFSMGGAASHDISDGILDPKDRYFSRNRRRLEEQGKYMYRIKGRSWWEEEMPSNEEYEHARETLKKNNYKVDYIISHCAPTRMQIQFNGNFEPDKLTDFLNEIYVTTQFTHWYCGHYHANIDLNKKFTVLYRGVRKVGK